ncbi:hypothetical protein H9Q13_11095 [Pontibacter sp. JH31]|uniref:Glycosyltransferase family 1 protein n=1 Tax=Pontibacter aquaedesilientis TaxID=2766980 RepID=A0ABR7XIE2_9BACT|nr:hypothetical protein [Pontibacter aquaedesilientis]MBD1397711.1 hypothetical protein [Pontibacter aquaedesilientis]
MKKNKIYVIHSNSKIESLYTLFPLIISKYSSFLEFMHLDSKEVMQIEGECVILVRAFKGNQSFKDDVEKKRDFIKSFKKRFDRVIMLDDGAGSDSLHYEYMDLVDLYYKGKLLINKENYLKPMYGSQLFTDYYNTNFGVTDEKIKIRSAPSDPTVLNKLRVSWNLGCGVYPMPNQNIIKIARGFTTYNFPKLLKPWYQFNYNKMINELNKPINYASKLKLVHARFGYKGLPNTIAYQRQLLLNKCKINKKVISGKINQKAYNAEIKGVASVLSPFGWGEVCFRDFEAVLNGALLIKPNMDMLETWPNIYLSSKTYLPIDWNGENLLETIESVTDSLGTYYDIVETAREEYKNSLLSIDAKVQSFLQEASKLTIF